MSEINARTYINPIVFTDTAAPHVVFVGQVFVDQVRDLLQIARMDGKSIDWSTLQTTITKQGDPLDPDLSILVMTTRSETAE